MEWFKRRSVWFWLPVGFAAFVAFAVINPPAGTNGTIAETETGESEPVATELDVDAQMARSERCMERHRFWRDDGVWAHGGARPGVVRERWDELTSDQQQEIIDIAACIATGGQTTPVEVEITGEGGIGVLASDTVDNTQMF